jgi:heme/copper-type cytochrome/quinol oxidase subunit 2
MKRIFFVIAVMICIVGTSFAQQLTPEQKAVLQKEVTITLKAEQWLYIFGVLENTLQKPADYNPIAGAMSTQFATALNPPKPDKEEAAKNTVAPEQVKPEPKGKKNAPKKE